jgi:ligand-binding sensor domain-containing protein
MKIAIVFLFFLLFTPLSKPQSKPGWINYLTANDIQCIAKEVEYLWIGTTGGLIKYNYIDETYDYLDKINDGLPHHDIKSIVIDSVGNKWLGSWGGGLIKYDNESWQVYNQKNSGLNNDFIEAVTIDSSGNLWIAPNFMSVIKYDGINWISYNDSSVLGSSDVSYLNVDKLGQLWVATRWGGVTKYDGVEWQTYAPHNSQIPDSYINTIFIDDSNFVWVGTSTGGMAFVNWTSFFNSPIPSKKINSIVTINGHEKWIGSEKGITTYDDFNWNVIQFPNLNLLSNEIFNLESDNSGNTIIATGFAFPYIIKYFQNHFEEIFTYSIAPLELEIDEDNIIWIADMGTGVGKYDGVNWTYYNSSNSGLTNDYVLCVYPDGDSLIWFGTWGGLYKFDGDRWMNYNSSNSPLVSDNVSAVVRDKNSILWIGQIPRTIGGSDGGLFSFDGTEWTWYNYDNSSLPSNRVIKLKIGQNNAKWIATQPFPADYEDLGGGVACLTEDSTWIVYDTSSSKIETNWITDIAVDTGGFVFVTTKPMWKGPINTSEFYGGGVYVIKDSIRSLFQVNNSALCDNHVSAISIDIYGNKWFGTKNGITVYNENGVITSIENSTNVFNDFEYHLLQNYPNPFNSSTIIKYQIPASGNVTLKVYDILGSKVATIVDNFQNEGRYEVNFNASKLASGVYLYRLKINDYVDTKKMLMIK